MVAKMRLLGVISRNFHMGVAGKCPFFEDPHTKDKTL